MDVVDLTDDSAETRSRAAPPPLPSIPAALTTLVPVSARHHPYSIGNSANFSFPHPSPMVVTQQHHTPWPTVRLSLINTQEFTAKASSTVSKEVGCTDLLFKAQYTFSERFGFIVHGYIRRYPPLSLLKEYVLIVKTASLYSPSRVTTNLW